MFFKAVLPVDAIKVLVTEAKANPLSVTTFDAAFQVGGNLNAYRSALGVYPAALAAKFDAMSEEDLAIALEHEMSMMGTLPPAGTMMAVPAFLLQLIFALVTRLLQKFIEGGIGNIPGIPIEV